MTTTLPREEVRKIGYEKGLREVDLDIFVDFVKDRFPDEWDKTYINQWAGRFMRGNGFCYMDKYSFRSYLKALQKNWARFGYDVDFKYGKPAKVKRVSRPKRVS